MTEREYKELVLADFDQKLAAGLLRPELVSHTRRSLKALSIDVCAHRFDPKDKLLISSWFGDKEDSAAYMRAIQNTSAEDFRTLNNFLNDRKINTDFDNINFLAWLIDFRPRPYHPDLIAPAQAGGTITTAVRNDAIDPDTPVLPKEDDEISSAMGGEVIVSGAGSTVKINKKTVFFVAVVVLVSLTGYFIVNQKHRLTGHEGCMVWSGDQYESIDCKEKRGNLPVLKLDMEKIARFKRVNADTLSPRALGYVWYAKINGQMEYYSDSGLHPTDTNRRVLPLTSRILKVHVYHVSNSR